MCVVPILTDMFWGIKRKNSVSETIKVYKPEMYSVFLPFLVNIMTAYFATYDRRLVEIPGIGSSDRFGK